MRTDSRIPSSGPSSTRGSTFPEIPLPLPMILRALAMSTCAREGRGVPREREAGGQKEREAGRATGGEIRSYGVSDA